MFGSLHRRHPYSLGHMCFNMLTSVLQMRKMARVILSCSLPQELHTWAQSSGKYTFGMPHSGYANYFETNKCFSNIEKCPTFKLEFCIFFSLSFLNTKCLNLPLYFWIKKISLSAYKILLKFSSCRIKTAGN